MERLTLTASRNYLANLVLIVVQRNVFHAVYTDFRKQNFPGHRTFKSIEFVPPLSMN
ncbi:hypothetical protein [Novosphingobium sp. ERN07]|uniref:hypothetical protein n=1 Tax=Novosphingobium sp. ERN07 TaxID=2726187 RepID=UPI0014575B29|nr:hypothetical protein [Novosphingobium sp. ERN07]